MSTWRFGVFLLLVCWGVMAFGAVDCGREYQMADGSWTTSAGAAANSFMGKKGQYANCKDYAIYPEQVTAGPDENGFYHHNWSYCNGNVIGFGDGTGTVQWRTRTCECAAPNIEVDGKCVDPCSQDAGRPFFSVGGTDDGTFVTKAPNLYADAQPMCHIPENAGPGERGCVVKGEKTMSSCHSESECYVWQNNVKYTGTSCAGTEVAPGTSTPAGSTGTVATLPNKTPGKCPGEVNGQTVLVDCPEKSVPTTTKTSTVEVTNPDGSKTITNTTTGESVTCQGSMCTSTREGLNKVDLSARGSVDPAKHGDG